MGHDEDKNNFGGGTTPENPINVAPNPRATIAKNRIGMRPARDFSAETAQEELNRISGVAPQAQATGGDIVLNNSPVKKGKKPLIILVITAIIVIVFVTALVVINSIKSESNKFHSSGDYKKEFNQFVNYLVSGEAKEDLPVKTKNSYKQYEFGKSFGKNEDERKKYVKEAYEIFGIFKADFSNASIKDEALKTRVDGYYDVLKMIYLYETSDKLEDYMIVQEYMENSESSARKRVEGSYAGLAESDSEVAKEYAKKLREAGQAYLVQLTRYNSSGCISRDKGVDQTCINQKIPYDSDSRDYVKKYRAVQMMYDSAISEVANECWTILEMIKIDGE